MMWRDFLGSEQRLQFRADPKESSTTCVVTRWSRIESDCALRVFGRAASSTALPRKPLAPVTSVTLSAMCALDDPLAGGNLRFPPLYPKPRKISSVCVPCSGKGDHMGRCPRQRDRLPNHREYRHASDDATAPRCLGAPPAGPRTPHRPYRSARRVRLAFQAIQPLRRRTSS